MSDSSQNPPISHLISPHSVSVYGESVGHSAVSEEAIMTLSYDVSYRLYEILKECRTEMNVYRQTTLSTTILRNVLENYGIPPLYGNKFLVPYVSIPNSDMSVLHLNKIDVLEQSTTDSINVEVEQTPFIKGLYISPLTKIGGIVDLMKSLDNATITKTEPMDEDTYSVSNLRSFALNIKSENLSDEPNGDFSIDVPLRNEIESVNRLESDYYLVVAPAILNSSENLLKIVLEDLKTNPRLGNVYPSLLNLICNSIQNFTCCGKLIDRLLRTLEALLDNVYVDPSAFQSVDDTVNAVCSIILEPKIANDCDDFPYRMKANYLLMRALNIWNVSVDQKKKILVTLQKALLNPEKMSLKLNYSVLLMCYSLGCDNLDAHFWPVLSKYLHVLYSLEEIISGKRSILLTNDLCHVKSALMLVSCILYRNFWNDDPSIQKLHMEADVLLCSYFGECIFPIRSYALPKNSEVFANSASKLKQRGNKEVILDIEKNYRNIQLFSYRKKYLPHLNNLINRPQRYHYTANDVFDISLRYPRMRTIIFNFIGSNQINHTRIKKLDGRYNVQFTGHSRGQIFLKYQKTTRCIKFCNTSTKNCSGDIFLFL